MTRNKYYLNLELYHHGVKGQKWGVRRYEDENGKLTDVGKKHYYNTDSNGRLSLNNNGYKYNRESHQKVKKYADTTLYNVSKIDKSFESNKQKIFRCK